MYCEVCNKRESIGVAASAWLPTSNRYCGPCLANNAEPIGNLVLLYEMNDGDVVEPLMNTVTWIPNHGYLPFAHACSALIATSDAY